MATDCPSLLGLRDLNVFGASSTSGCLSSCRNGFTSTWVDCPVFLNSERGLREIAGCAGNLVVDSTGFRTGALIVPRASTVRGVRAPVAGSAGGGAINGECSPGDTVRAVPRDAGAILVLLSASALASRRTSELPSVSVLVR